MPYSTHDNVAMARDSHPAEMALEDLIRERDQLAVGLEEHTHMVRDQIEELDQIIDSVRRQASNALVRVEANEGELPYDDHD